MEVAHGSMKAAVAVCLLLLLLLLLVAMVGD